MTCKPLDCRCPDCNERRRALHEEVRRRAAADHAPTVGLEVALAPTAASFIPALLSGFAAPTLEGVESCPFEGAHDPHELRVEYGLLVCRVRPEIAEQARRCIECEGTKHRMLRSNGRDHVEECLGHRVTLGAVSLVQASIPAEALLATLDRPLDAYQTSVFRRLERSALEFTAGDKGWWIAGDVGRGKSWLAAAFTRDVCLRHGVRARFVAFDELIEEIRSSRRHRSDYGELEILAPFIEVPLLVIDDVGASHDALEFRTLDRLVAARARRASGTMVITSNHDLDALSHQARLYTRTPAESDLGPLDRTVSRLRAMVRTVTLLGPDRRA